jgi:hypothetical protein
MIKKIGYAIVEFLFEKFIKVDEGVIQLFCQLSANRRFSCPHKSYDENTHGNSIGL